MIIYPNRRRSEINAIHHHDLELLNGIRPIDKQPIRAEPYSKPEQFVSVVLETVENRTANA